MHEPAHIAYSALPAFLVLWPLGAAALVWPLGRWREDVRNGFMLLVTGVTLLGAAALVPLIAEEHRVTSRIPALIGDLTFTVDPYSMLFALFTAFVWLCATLYSLDYLKHEHAHDRFHTVNLVVLGAMMGVVLAGDLVTLYLFFELLGLVAFLFVIHTETSEAKTAAWKYLWMTLLGGFALIGGIFLTYAIGGHGTIAPLPLEGASETLRWAAFALLLLGFGVKAGMLPVHVWLPDAHPVAPSPASALLSGVMIKAGAYGIFRTVTALFRPAIIEEASEELWHMTGTFGLAVLWIGIATMAIGVIMALGQHNAKRMLAYHSVSQMGFILAGIGAAGYLGTHGALGVAGGLFHVVNHALFKAALFLGVGAVLFRTGELDMYKLGGLWRRMPLTFGFMLVAAAGITGMPLFNGFVSKCLIHHALVEAYEYHHLFSLNIAEKIYIVTCGGTACSFIKLIGFVFLGSAKREYGPEVTDAPPRMLISLGLLSAAIVTLGLRPHLLLRGVFAPGLHVWGLHSDLIESYLTKYFLSPADLMSVVIAFAIGATIFVTGVKFGLFHKHAPAWFGVDYWYRAGARGFLVLSRYVTGWYERYLTALSRTLRDVRTGYRSAYARASRSWRRTVTTILTGAPGPREQHFIQVAYLALERERAATVRHAVRQTYEWLRSMPDTGDGAATSGDTSTPEAKATVDAVRDIASYMAARQFNQRMGVLADAVRAGRIDRARLGLDEALRSVARTRSEVGHSAMEFAGRRMAGEDVLRDIAAKVNELSSREVFADVLYETAPAMQPPPTLLHPTVSSAEFVSSAAALEQWHARGVGRLEHAARWMLEMLRLVVVATTQERSGYALGSTFDPESVLQTRRQIQRYARDMSLNMAVIVIVLLVFLSGIVAGIQR